MSPFMAPETLPQTKITTLNGFSHSLAALRSKLPLQTLKKRLTSGLRDFSSRLGIRAQSIWQRLPGFQTTGSATAEGEGPPDGAQNSSAQSLHVGAFQPWQSPVSDSLQSSQEPRKEVSNSKAPQRKICCQIVSTSPVERANRCTAAEFSSLNPQKYC